MELRLATRDDGEACNEFHNRIYHNKRNLIQWQWEFLPRAFPTDSLPYVIAIDQGKIVGTQAFILIKMVDESGAFWSVKSEETLVDPSYRGKKLFERMYFILFDFLKQHGIHCIWGFTRASKAFERIGFKVPQATAQIFFPFSGLAVPALIEKQTAVIQKGVAAKISALGYRSAGSMASFYSSLRYRTSPSITADDFSDIEIHDLDSALLKAENVSKRFIQLYGGVTIHRDANYLQWRLFDNPYIKAIVLGAFNQDRLLGWIAYSIGDDGMGYIVDIMVAPFDNMNQEVSRVIRRLIVAAVTDLKRIGALGVRGWTVNKHPFDIMILNVAKSLGFYHIKRGYNMVLYVNPESDRRERIELLDRWFVTRIYTEGVTG